MLDGLPAIDRLAADAQLPWDYSEKWGAAWAKSHVLLVKPATYMNRSGQPLSAISNFYKIAAAEILVVLDDFALPLGRLRLRVTPCHQKEWTGTGMYRAGLACRCCPIKTGSSASALISGVCASFIATLRRSHDRTWREPSPCRRPRARVESRRRCVTPQRRQARRSCPIRP